MRANDGIEARLESIERKIELILDRLVNGSAPGPYELERALKAASRGNKGPLWDYIEKGGKPNGRTDR